MNYPPSSSDNNPSESKSFYLLDEKVRKWIWQQDWQELRTIQEKSIPLVLSANTDIIISSPTASGKTEAAFLPIFSKLAQNQKKSVQALYISPLKALINDQFERLYDLSEILEIPVFKWHGDISYHLKKKLLSDPKGILQITPESLESLLINHTTECTKIFLFLEYIVIDELHYFIGTERGKQLQSILNRIEIIQKRKIPRIGLSATLGDMSLAEKYLRPNLTLPITVIDTGSIQLETKLQIRGYSVGKESEDGLDSDKDTDSEMTTKQICYHLFNNLRGKSNLIFANSRANVEKYTDVLTRISQENHLPIEFYPHHGNLSKQLREQVEEKLKNKEFPTSAVCTSTLELGIDIGSVHSIAQVGVPPSVSSMRQRLGRSGRRGEPAIVRIYIEERDSEITTSIQDCLRAELFQTVAMVELLIQKWFEPPIVDRLHLSTLLHQILALIAQYGGVSTQNLWSILIERGVFQNITKKIFFDILREMGNQELIKQVSEGTLVLGIKGEALVNHYEFYSVFITPEEYRLIFNNSVLGTLPVDFPIYIGLFIIFAGKRWKVIDVNEEKKIIELAPSIGGKPPKFFGSGGYIHDRIREEMFRRYMCKQIPNYLDEKARQLFNEGLEFFEKLSLSKRSIVQDGKDVLLFIWYGDRIVNTLLLLFRYADISVLREGFCIRILNSSPQQFSEFLMNFVNDNSINALQLSKFAKNKKEQKYDVFLSEELLDEEYCSRYIDLLTTLSIIPKLHL